MFLSPSDDQPPHPLRQTLIPRYLSAVASIESVSVSQPPSSTSTCYHGPLHLLVTPSPPCCFVTSTPPPPPSTRRPSGNHVNPKPIRGGLDEGLGGQPGPLCSPAQWRIKLACGGLSLAVGHSRQPGSGAWPALHPLHHHHRTPADCTPPSTSPGSLPILPRTLRLTSRQACLFCPSS